MAVGDMEECYLEEAIWHLAKSHHSGRISQISKCMGPYGRLNGASLTMSVVNSPEPVDMLPYTLKGILQV